MHPNESLYFDLQTINTKNKKKIEFQKCRLLKIRFLKHTRSRRSKPAPNCKRDIVVITCHMTTWHVTIKLFCWGLTLVAYWDNVLSSVFMKSPRKSWSWVSWPWTMYACPKDDASELLNEKNFEANYKTDSHASKLL